MVTKLSKFFNLEEFTASDTAKAKGIDNSPSEIAIVNITRLHDNVMLKVRKSFGVPVTITSGYRSKLLNQAVGGTGNSQHTSGQACDFVVKGQSCEAVFNWCRKNLIFDQLILEVVGNSKWVHISYNIDNNRRMSMKYDGKKYITV